MPDSPVGPGEPRKPARRASASPRSRHAHAGTTRGYQPRSFRSVTVSDAFNPGSRHRSCAGRRTPHPLPVDRGACAAWPTPVRRTTCGLPDALFSTSRSHTAVSLPEKPQAKFRQSVGLAARDRLTRREYSSAHVCRHTAGPRAARRPLKRHEKRRTKTRCA